VTRTAVVAIGGNALVTDNAHGSIHDQFIAAGRIARQVAQMAGNGWTVVVTHGNGPQAGFILRRSDIVARIDSSIPRIALDIAVADSQGGIGYIVATSLTNALHDAGIEREVVAVVTHTLVDAADPAFQNPSKPIGSFLGREEAEGLVKSDGWAIVEDSGRGYRRVVASPRPLRILELAAIAALVRGGFMVIPSAFAVASGWSSNVRRRFPARSATTCASRSRPATGESKRLSTRTSPRLFSPPAWASTSLSSPPACPRSRSTSASPASASSTG